MVAKIVIPKHPHNRPDVKHFLMDGQTLDSSHPVWNELSPQGKHQIEAIHPVGTRDGFTLFSEDVGLQFEIVSRLPQGAIGWTEETVKTLAHTVELFDGTKLHPMTEEDYIREMSPKTEKERG